MLLCVGECVLPWVSSKRKVGRVEHASRHVDLWMRTLRNAKWAAGALSVFNILSTRGTPAGRVRQNMLAREAYTFLPYISIFHFLFISKINESKKGRKPNRTRGKFCASFSTRLSLMVIERKRSNEQGKRNSLLYEAKSEGFFRFFRTPDAPKPCLKSI